MAQAFIADAHSDRAWIYSDKRIEASTFAAAIGKAARLAETERRDRSKVKRIERLIISVRRVHTTLKDTASTPEA